FTLPLAIPPEHPWQSHIARHGHYGVQLFFVISGFILALPFASYHLKGAAPVNLKRYYLRRVTRLEPPYVLTMVGFFCLLVWFHGQSAANLSFHLAYSLLYLHGPALGSQSIVNPIAWSLEIEVQFYLLVPFLTQLFAIRGTVLRRSVIAGLGLLFMACQLWFSPDRGPFSFTIASHLQYFLVGFLLADVYLTEWDEAPSHERKWDYVSLIGWPLLLVVCESPGLTQLLLPAMLFVLYAAAFRSAWVSCVLTSPWVTTVGGMCYTIYLLHYQLLSLIGRRTKALVFFDSFSLNLLVQFLIVGPLVLVLSVAFFALIERPCMRSDWPIRIWQKVKPFVSVPG
ncbi:MAG: acyltransferase family protein, partial [Candidatus Methylomirabilis sp.]